MRTHDGYDARDSYEHAQDAMGENVHNRNDDIESHQREFEVKNGPPKRCTTKI